MTQRKRYDYNDMINWVIDLLERDQQLLLSYQEAFQYILVDEYQDTNGSQNKLLQLLINYWDDPNVFVVGDDDQSIYKFQGANVENISAFRKQYADVIRMVVLEENYRSTPAILKGSNAVIRYNEERIINEMPDLSKDIRSAHPEYQQIETPIQIRSYPNTYQEIIAISNALKAANKAGTPYSEMAILYRNHKQSVDLMNYLQSEQIPFNVSMSQDVLEVPVVRQLLQLLSYLQMESSGLDLGQHHLFEILHFNQFKHLNPLEIGKMALQLKANYKVGWRVGIHDLLQQPNQSDLAPDSIKELRRFTDDRFTDDI
jgi:DNA helicase-2/ATP-dependent DNA helicase PcrA